MDEQQYWVGERADSKMTWLFDSFMPHEDPKMVYLFNVDKGELREYPKYFARTVLRPVTGDRKEQAVQAYENWYAANGNGFLEKDRERRRRAMEARKVKEEKERAQLAKRRAEAIERHKKYLVRHGKEYQGVSTVRDANPRVTHCYSCKENLDSRMHIQCKSCDWLICYCGACGCGYEA